MVQLRILPPAARYFKKLKDKKLKLLYQDAINSILCDPEIGEDIGSINRYRHSGRNQRKLL